MQWTRQHDSHLDVQVKTDAPKEEGQKDSPASPRAEGSGSPLARRKSRRDTNTGSLRRDSSRKVKEDTTTKTEAPSLVDGTQRSSSKIFLSGTSPKGSEVCDKEVWIAFCPSQNNSLPCRSKKKWWRYCLNLLLCLLLRRKRGRQREVITRLQRILNSTHPPKKTSKSLKISASPSLPLLLLLLLVHHPRLL